MFEELTEGTTRPHRKRARRDRPALRDDDRLLLLVLLRLPLLLQAVRAGTPENALGGR